MTAEEEEDADSSGGGDAFPAAAATELVRLQQQQQQQQQRIAALEPQLATERAINADLVRQQNATSAGMDVFAVAGEVMPHILSFVAPSYKERLGMALLSKALLLCVEKYCEILYNKILLKADATFPNRILDFLGNQSVDPPFRCRLGAAVRIPLYRIARQISSLHHMQLFPGGNRIAVTVSRERCDEYKTEVWDLSTKQLSISFASTPSILFFPSDDRIAVCWGDLAGVLYLTNEKVLGSWRGNVLQQLLVDDRLVLKLPRGIYVCSETETGKWNVVRMYRTNAKLERLVHSKDREILFLERNGAFDSLLKFKSLDVRDGTVHTNFEFDVADQGFDPPCDEFDFLMCENKWLLILVPGPWAGTSSARIYVVERLDAYQYRPIHFFRLRSSVRWLSMEQAPDCSTTIYVHNNSEWEDPIVSVLDLNEGRLSQRSFFTGVPHDHHANEAVGVLSRSRVVALDGAFDCCVYNVVTGEREFALGGHLDPETATVSLARNELLFRECVHNVGDYGRDDCENVVTAYCLDETRILALEEQPTAANSKKRKRPT